MLPIVEAVLLVVLCRTRRHLVTPALFLYCAFALGSALTDNPFDPYFVSIMTSYSDVLKAGMVLEAFLLLSGRLPVADRCLSGSIGVLAAMVLTTAAGHQSAHARVLVWLAAFWLASLWWGWRRGEEIPRWLWRHGWLLGAYLVSKAVPVVLWGWIARAGLWREVEGAARFTAAVIWLLWMYGGPQVLKRREQVGASNIGHEHDYAQDHVSHRFTHSL